jgi:hypothetical protein
VELLDSSTELGQRLTVERLQWFEPDIVGACLEENLVRIAIEDKPPDVPDDRPTFDFDAEVLAGRRQHLCAEVQVLVVIGVVVNRSAGAQVADGDAGLDMDYQARLVPLSVEEEGSVRIDRANGEALESTAREPYWTSS